MKILFIVDRDTWEKKKMEAVREIISDMLDELVAEGSVTVVEKPDAVHIVYSRSKAAKRIEVE